MKLNQSDVFHHITGNYPLQELTLEEANERNEPCWVVGWQQGFEVYSVAVYGDGLCDQDAMEAGFPAWMNRSPDWRIENPTPTLPEDIRSSDLQSVVHGHPSSAKRLVAYRFKDGSGCGVYVESMGAHLLESQGLEMEFVSVCDHS